MTVPATTRRSPVYSGNGVTLVFPFSFKVFLPTDIQVIVTSVGGAIAPATYITDYSVTLNPDQTVAPGGSISYQPGFVPLPTGAKLVIIGNLPYSQTLALPGGGNFNPVAIENNFDRTEMQIQQLASGLDAAISVPVGETVPPLPAAAVRAGYMLGFDSLGNPIAVIPASGSVGTLAIDLANTVTPTKGAGQVGFGSALTYPLNTIGRAVADMVATVTGIVTSAGSSLVGYIVAGGVSRNVQARLRDSISVVDFGAVGDGTTDDTTAIQNAINTRKTVFFPKPSAFYKTTAALSVFYNSHLTGEEGVTSLIRRTSGSGSVLDFLGSNENALIENLRIGGAGTTNITVGGGGYANYLSTLTCRNVHFEADSLVNVNANLIACNFTDCTFGYFQQTSVNPNLQHVVSSTGGAGNTNVNLFTNCRFFNGGTTVASVSFTSGLVLTFTNCQWENNGRDLITSNVQNCLLLNCYTERGKHATSQFDFGATRVRTKIIGGQFNGGLMPAAASMFRAVETTGSLMVEDADVSVTASAFMYQNATTASHSLPASGVHQIRNSRIQGNAADPLLYLDNVIEDAVYAFTPVPVSLTVFNGSGGATYSGTYSIRNRMVTVTFRIVTTGTCTTASTGGTTYFPLPTSLPVPQVPSTGGANNENAGASLGVGLAYINGRFFPPSWTAQAGNVSMSMTYPI